MAKQTINIGASPNDGTGTPLRTVFDYTNQNFTELYTATGPSGNNIVVPGSATITGDLTVDTNVLKVDTTLNRVGILTAAPTAPLDILGNSLADALLIRGNDNANTKIRMVNSGASGEEFSLSVGYPGASNSSFVLRSITAGINRYIADQTGAHFWATNAGTAMTLNASGLGVGRSPAFKLDVSSATNSSHFRISGANQNSLTLGNAAGTASTGFLMGRSFSSDDANNFFIFDSTASALRFFIGNTGNVGIGTAAPTEAVDVNSGNLKLTNGNVVLGTSGKGIDFSATPNPAGMTSELLNDYEEGTWVATVRGTVSDPTVPLTATCRYTKVGRQVFVEGVIDGNTTGASGQVFISSLPFASAAGSIERPGSVQLNNMATFTGYATAYIAASQLNINFYSSASGGALGNVIHNPGAGRTIWFGITYTV